VISNVIVKCVFFLGRIVVVNTFSGVKIAKKILNKNTLFEIKFDKYLKSKIEFPGFLIVK